MEYKILYAYAKSLSKATEDLEKEVNQHCAKGWKPQGGVSLATEKHGYMDEYNLTQAMIKEQ